MGGGCGERRWGRLGGAYLDRPHQVEVRLQEKHILSCILSQVLQLVPPPEDVRSVDAHLACGYFFCLQSLVVLLLKQVESKEKSS